MPDTKLKDNIEENVYKLDDVDRKNYLKEMDEYFKVLDNYYNNSKDYTKSLMNYAFASLAVKHYVNEGVVFDTSKLSELTEARDVVYKDLLDKKALPYIDGTQMFIDALKPIDIGYKYGITTPSILKTESEKWHDITVKNVDFKEVENAIDSIDVLKYIQFKNCKFINCKTNDLEHINCSHESNNFIKTGRTAKVPDFSKKFEKPKERNWKYEVGMHSKLLQPNRFHAIPGNKIRLDVPYKDGTHEWYFPKDWVRPSRTGIYLAIPKNIALGDITCKEPNSDKAFPAKAIDLINSTNFVAAKDFRYYDGYEVYTSLMKEKSNNHSNAIEKFSLTSSDEKQASNSKPLSAKGFHDFVKENKSRNSLKPNSKEHNDLNRGDNNTR